MKQHTHRAVVAVALIMLLISFSGVMGNKAYREEAADADPMSQEAFNQIITEEQHSYQVANKTEQTIEPPEWATVIAVDFVSDNEGRVLWEDVDENEQETPFSVNNGIILLDEEVDRELDRQYLISWIQGKLEAEDTE